MRVADNLASAVAVPNANVVVATQLIVVFVVITILKGGITAVKTLPIAAVDAIE